MMSFSWEDNCIGHASQTWVVYSPVGSGSKKGDERPAYTPVRAIWHTLGFYWQCCLEYEWLFEHGSRKTTLPYCVLKLICTYLIELSPPPLFNSWFPCEHDLQLIAYLRGPSVTAGLLVLISKQILELSLVSTTLSPRCNMNTDEIGDHVCLVSSRHSLLCGI